MLADVPDTTVIVEKKVGIDASRTRQLRQPVFPLYVAGFCQRMVIVRSPERRRVGRNLTDEKIFTAAFDTAGVPSKFAALKPPRNLVVELSYDFN